MKIGITGCAGRMGQMLVREVLLADDCTLAGGTEGPGHTALGQDVAQTAGLEACGLAISDNSEALFAASDAVIDFTIAEVTESHARFPKKYSTNLILGTTGHDGSQLAAIEAAAACAPIVKAMNFSVGVNVLFALTKQLAGALDENFDIEIVEMHHRFKVDAPSGTARSLAEASGRTPLTHGRQGHTGERPRGGIGMHALRGGDVAGEHTFYLAGPGERLQLGHLATSRATFAEGAIRAARWLRGKPAGVYTMRDVLGL